MMSLPEAAHCRLSGESLAQASPLFELEDCPLPGVYPATAEEASSLRVPFRVLQARRSGLVQLAHRLEASVYEAYAFACSTSQGYAGYLDGLTEDLAARYPKHASILEVGCGDGSLLRRLAARGYSDLLGIDPSLSAEHHGVDLPLVRGYFPGDLPIEAQSRTYDLIVTRHVLEHIERPGEFVGALVEHLSHAGELWIEVPDLASTVERRLWSNFYPLHCSYFESATLDALLAGYGLACQGGKVVEVFGGSLLRRYARGVAAVAPPPPTRWPDLGEAVKGFSGQLRALAERLPPGSVGYGAGERTAVTLGLGPTLGESLRVIYDGNPLLDGRYLAGTTIPIRHKVELWNSPPVAVLLFALSHQREILSELREQLPGETLIAVADGSATCQPLSAVDLT